MNIALEQTEEHVNGAVTNRYGDAFIRGNNGMSITPHGWSPCSNFYSIHSPVHLGLRPPMILKVPDHSLGGSYYRSRLCPYSQCPCLQPPTHHGRSMDAHDLHHDWNWKTSRECRCVRFAAVGSSGSIYPVAVSAKFS